MGCNGAGRRLESLEKDERQSTEFSSFRFRFSETETKTQQTEFLDWLVALCAGIAVS